MAEMAEVSQRLSKVYREMTDEQLEQLAAQPEDLTSTAEVALHAEMGRRGLAVPQISSASKADPDEDVGVPAAAEVIASNLGAWGPEIELTTFHDATQAGRACEFLEGAGIPFHLTDVSERTGFGSFDGGPVVALRVTVLMSDVERARGVLRRAMGLFPEQEVEEADDLLDDGSQAVLGVFSTRAEAEEIAGVLTQAGIWNGIVETTGDAEHPFSIEVREVDLLRAGEAVEKGLK